MNVDCGSEYVQKQKKCPQNLVIRENAKYVSIDGDADRIVYL